MATTMTDTINYSGMLHTKTDDKNRFLDAVYARGKNGGTTQTYSEEFVLSSGYDMEDPAQPAISETASQTAPVAETTSRTQETNVVQIFQRTASVSYKKQTNRNALGGLNVAGAQGNTPSELDFQMARRVEQVKRDLNYTLVNGVYQYTKGSTTVANKTRGLLTAITSNKFDVSAAALSKSVINDAIRNSIKNGAAAEVFEIWTNPADIDIITDAYSSLPGVVMPASRTDGGLSYERIMTPYGVIELHWEPTIPTGNILLLNMGELAVAEKPYQNDRGEMVGSLFAEPMAKIGAAETWQLYGEFGCDYGAEWHHALIHNYKTGA